MIWTLAPCTAYAKGPYTLATTCDEFGIGSRTLPLIVKVTYRDVLKTLVFLYVLYLGFSF